MSEWVSKCLTCDYFMASKCKRYPPQPYITTAAGVLMKVTPAFPEVKPDDWCGEYQPEKKAFRDHMEKTL